MVWHGYRLLSQEQQNRRLKRLLFLTTNQQRFAYRHWVDGAVVFDRDTGDTHLLDALSSRIVQFISCAPAPSNLGDFRTLAKVSALAIDAPLYELSASIDRLIDLKICDRTTLP